MWFGSEEIPNKVGDFFGLGLDKNATRPPALATHATHLKAGVTKKDVFVL
ncbi:MAG: hypothetical protein Q8O48_00745 [Anaerolineales bacterium]|nr:hypothetical protein [Anaerolineales bacterium]